MSEEVSIKKKEMEKRGEEMAELAINLGKKIAIVIDGQKANLPVLIQAFCYVTCMSAIAVDTQNKRPTKIEAIEDLCDYFKETTVGYLKEHGVK